MTRLIPVKLHTEHQIPHSQKIPRRYTLTHSDRTGDLFLTVASDYNRQQISGLYTRVMRDEVIAEWIMHDETPSLHISGGLVFAGAQMRENIFRREMPLVLEAIRYGDSEFFETFPEFDNAQIILHFQKSSKDYKLEGFGVPSVYCAHK